MAGTPWGQDRSTPPPDRKASDVTLWAAHLLQEDFLVSGQFRTSEATYWNILLSSCVQLNLFLSRFSYLIFLEHVGIKFGSSQSLFSNPLEVTFLRYNAFQIIQKILNRRTKKYFMMSTDFAIKHWTVTHTASSSNNLRIQLTAFYKMHHKNHHEICPSRLSMNLDDVPPFRTGNKFLWLATHSFQKLDSLDTTELQKALNLIFSL